MRRWELIGKLSANDAQRNFQDVLKLFPLTLPTASILDRSRRLVPTYSLSHWDSLLVAAAIEAGADTLYTEDLQAGATYDGLTIVNPFA